MADWFETRFREPVDPGRPDPTFVARMRALVVEEWLADTGTRSDETSFDDREGDITMLETKDRPTAQDPMPSRRGTITRWLSVAAAVLVVAVAGMLVATRDEDRSRIATVPSGPPATIPTKDLFDDVGPRTVAVVEPGRYYIDPDDDPTTPLRVTLEIPSPPQRWAAQRGTFDLLTGVTDEGAGLGVAIVTNVATDGCLDLSPLDPPVGPTVDDLTAALSQLAPLELNAPPTDVTISGYEGKHLALSNPEFVDCADGDMMSKNQPVTGRSLPGSAVPGHTVEFWILDVEGTRLVLLKFDTPQDSTDIQTERDAIFDSIRIEP